MTQQRTFQTLAQFAEEQWGLVTRRQAKSAGLSAATITRLIARGDLERQAEGVYHLRGAPLPDLVDLRAAWLQLAPEVPAWQRTSEQGVVSHRSAASVYRIGHLPADVHEFTLAQRRQTRRRDLRLHTVELSEGECATVRGLPVTRPSRIAADLLRDREDPDAIGHVIADAIRSGYVVPATFAAVLAPFAARFGLRRGDGAALLRWLLELTGDPQIDQWMNEVWHNAISSGGGAASAADDDDDRAAPSPPVGSTR